MFKNDLNRKKVFVGMSGGVDSSVSAALLQERGHIVTGVFIKTWSPDWLPCTWPEERRDAMRVAAKLKIPLLTFDFEKEYKEGVADYMISEYKAGRVPNPDVMCNKVVKFDAFLKKAKEMGADFIATGHYARVFHGGQKSEMFAGVDKEKDQTYFLWTLKQEQLKHVLFPIGDYQKSEVRKLAEKFDLPTATKKDSQGICFIGKLDMKDFLKEYIDELHGDVLNTKGEIIGRHDGASFYTMGQRHGFVISKKCTDNKPLFVVDKNLEQNTITVSDTKEIGTSFSRKIELVSLNWTQTVEPDFSKNYQARIRYRQALQNCKLVKEESGFFVEFETPQESIAPGQSVVIYDGEVCLGGGIIK